jgi:hypothetical protein
MNHKRRRPKHQRAGCLLCKPWKDERAAKSYPLKGRHLRDAHVEADADGESWAQIRREVEAVP